METRGYPAWFNGKSNARLSRAVLVTCVHFMVLFIWGQLSAVYPLSLSQRLPSFSNLNGLSLCSRVEERGGGGGGEDGDVYSDCSVILKIFVRPTSRLYLRLGRPIAHS